MNERSHPAQKPRLLYVVAEDWYFVSHRMDLAIRAIASGFDVSLVTKISQHGDTIRKAGIRIIPSNIDRSSRNPLYELYTVAKLAQLYRKECPSIVHHVALKPVLYGSIAAWIAGIPNVVNALGGLGHVFSSNTLSNRMLRPAILGGFHWLLSRRTTRVILQNPDDFALLQYQAKVPIDNLRLVRGAGVDLSIYCPSSPAFGMTITLPSRMLWQKGVGEFVEAARMLRSRGFAARFVIVGKPDPANPDSISEEKILEWHATGDIEWWGHRQDMPDVYHQSNIVCLPSYYGEGIPKTLIEAAACGLPIVTTDIPGCREIVRHEVNGLLVPPRNPKALAEALVRLMNSPADLVAMGKKGRKMAEAEFGNDTVIAATLEIYRELLESSSEPKTS